MSSLEVISVSCYCEECKTDVEIINVKYLGTKEPKDWTERMKEIYGHNYYDYEIELVLECGHSGLRQSFSSKESGGGYING